MGGGGGDYSDEVNYVRPSSTTTSFSDVSREEIMSKGEPDPSVLPINFHGIQIYKGQDVVVVIIDGTGSMGNDTFIIRDKIVLLEGQLRMKGYLKNPLILVCIVGDANSDAWPLQVTKPERGDALIAEIEKTFPEGGGGSHYTETYELAAYYFLNHLKLDDENAKPWLFFLGDEAAYPHVSAAHVRKFIGDKITENIRSETVFKELCEKFNVYRLHRKYQSESVDPEIVKQWKTLIGNQNVQRLTKPKEVVDDILGIIAVGSGERTIEGYLEDMRERGQDEERIRDVRKVVTGATKALVTIEHTPKLPGPKEDTKERSSGSKKL